MSFRKYYAKNDLTGRVVKKFWTKKGALRWIKRPIRMPFGKIRRLNLFLSIYQEI